MKKFLFYVFCVFSLSPHAQNAVDEGKAKAEPCAVCHGAGGISQNSAYPSLAGQHAPYLLKQLRDFQRDKTRHSAVMAAFLSGLTDQDLQHLVEYYAALPLPKNQMPKKYLELGQALYRGGSDSKQITACIACHGPAGMGNIEAGFPVLSGQQPVYTMQQLRAFKDKTRRNDMNAIMRDIAARMDARDMEAVAFYTAGLHE